MEIGSRSQTPNSTSRGRSVNTLAREGIAPANSSLFAGSQFAKSKGRRFSASDQQKASECLADKVKLSFERKRSIYRDMGEPSTLFLPRSSWISLGDGWFQITPMGTGSSTRCGMHSLVESSLSQLYMCLYEPRSKEVHDSCTGEPTEYDIEASLKSMRYSTGTESYQFELIFAFKSPTDYFSLICDVSNGTWSLTRCLGSEKTTVLSCGASEEIKPNLFYSILLQVRGNTVSVDVDNVPIFTTARPPDAVNMSGLMGLLAQGTKFALKGWKIRSMRVGVAPTHQTHQGLDNARRGGQAPVGRLNESLSRFSAPLPPPSDTGTMRVANGNTPIKSSNKTQSLKELMSMRTNENKSNSFQPASVSKGTSSRSTGGYPPPPPIPYGDNYNEEETMSRLGPPAVAMGGGGPGRRASATASSMSMSYSSAPTSARDSRTGTFVEQSDYLNPPKSIEDKTQECYHILAQQHERAVVDMVLGDIVQRDLGVTFDDISALHTAKRLLNEAVVLPLMMPELFTGIRIPWKGVLLFGPPGTGKTMLARGVAGLNQSTFFSCSAASLISKYRGESEKIVKCLFEAARLCAPSIIFLDEVDALVSKRGADSEHEASRRLKTEFFSQMDGIASTSGQDGTNVVVLATTNCPWDLDEAMRRRLEKRIYIPLPDFVSRRDMFSKCLSSIAASQDITVSSLAEMTAGYSGADIHLVCREAAMMPMRRLLSMYSPIELNTMKLEGFLNIPMVSLQDFIDAIKNTKSSVSSECIFQYVEWDKLYGSK